MFRATAAQPVPGRVVGGTGWAAASAPLSVLVLPVDEFGVDHLRVSEAPLEGSGPQERPVVGQFLSDGAGQAVVIPPPGGPDLAMPLRDWCDSEVFAYAQAEGVELRPGRHRDPGPQAAGRPRRTAGVRPRQEEGDQAVLRVATFSAG